MAIVDEYESWVEQYAEQGAHLGGMILVFGYLTKGITCNPT